MAAPTKQRFYTTASRKATASNGTTLVTISTATNANLANPDGNVGNGGCVIGVRVYNADTIAHGYLIHLVPSGGSAGVDTVMESVDNVRRFIQPSEVQYFCPPIELPFADSDFIQIKMTEVKATTEMQFLPITKEQAS